MFREEPYIAWADAEPFKTLCTYSTMSLSCDPLLATQDHEQTHQHDPHGLIR